MSTITLIAHLDGWLSPILPSHGWFQDEDTSIVFHILQGKSIRVREGAAAAATTVKVDPLKEAIADNAVLRCGDQLITVTEPADVGDNEITVSALSGTIGRGSTFYKVVDITGYTLSWELRASTGAAAALITKTGAITTPASGVSTVSIADTEIDTEITPGFYQHRLKRTDASNERLLAYGSACMRRAAA